MHYIQCIVVHLHSHLNNHTGECLRLMIHKPKLFMVELVTINELISWFDRFLIHQSMFTCLPIRRYANEYWHRTMQVVRHRKQYTSYHFIAILREKTNEYFPRTSSFVVFFFCLDGMKQWTLNKNIYDYRCHSQPDLNMVQFPIYLFDNGVGSIFFVFIAFL